MQRASLHYRLRKPLASTEIFGGFVCTALEDKSFNSSHLLTQYHFKLSCHAAQTFVQRRLANNVLVCSNA